MIPNLTPTTGEKWCGWTMLIIFIILGGIGLGRVIGWSYWLVTHVSISYEMVEEQTVPDPKIRQPGTSSEPHHSVEAPYTYQ